MTEKQYIAYIANISQSSSYGMQKSPMASGKHPSIFRKKLNTTCGV